MGEKKSGVFLASLFLLILFLGIVSAPPPGDGNGGAPPPSEGCWIENRADCLETDDPKEYILMGLSSSTNAHGETYNQGNYDYVLCCNFGNSIVPGECNGGKTILQLSSSSNAHAEVPGGTAYTGNDVCSQHIGSDCQTSPATDYNAILSLSGTTNAHIGHPGAYDTKIYCQTEYLGTYCGDGVVQTPNDLDQIEQCDDANNIDDDACSNNCELTFALLEPYPHWAVDEQAQADLTVKNVIVGTTEVFMNFENAESLPGVNIGDFVTFEIYEEGIGPDDKIRVGEDAIVGTVRADGDAIATWIISNSDLDKTNDDDEFYFKTDISSLESNRLDLTISQILSCGFINLCMDYGTPEDCGNDANLCQVGEYNVGLNNPEVNCDGVTCDCWWDITTLTCNSKWDLCKYTESTQTECSAENLFLTYSREASWDGGGESPDNGCVSGKNVVPCPAKIQLPFFNTYSIIAVIVIIALIYFLLNLKKKERKGRKISKRKK